MIRPMLPALAGLLLAVAIAPTAGAAGSQKANLERVYLQLTGMG